MHTKLYVDLGVHPDATPAQIKAAYRKLSKVHHPDSGGDRAEWDRISHAYEVLKDPARREKYDATGDDARMIDPEDLERAQVFNIVQTIISGLMNSSQDDPAFTDFRERILRDLTARGHQMKMDLANQEAKLKRLQRFVGRFKRPEGEDLIGDGVRQNLKNLERQTESIKIAQSLHEKVVQVFLSYQYETDQMEDEGQQSPTWPTHQRGTYLLGGSGKAPR